MLRHIHRMVKGLTCSFSPSCISLGRNEGANLNFGLFVLMADSANRDLVSWLSTAPETTLSLLCALPCESHQRCSQLKLLQAWDHPAGVSLAILGTVQNKKSKNALGTIWGKKKKKRGMGNVRHYPILQLQRPDPEGHQDNCEDFPKFWVTSPGCWVTL